MQVAAEGHGYEGVRPKIASSERAVVSSIDKDGGTKCYENDCCRGDKYRVWGVWGGLTSTLGWIRREGVDDQWVVLTSDALGR